MKKITKGEAPQALVVYATTTPGASYSGYVDKDLVSGKDKPLKNSILEEQGFICCYCNRAIGIDSMSVEHFIPQKRASDSELSDETHKNNELNYDNLLGSCNSGIRNCSGIRGNKKLTINPTLESCESIVKFYNNGIAYSENDVQNNEIENILKLNDKSLPASRAVVVKYAKDRVDKKILSAIDISKVVQEEMEFWKAKSEGRFHQFCMTAIHYLYSRIRQL
jgi:uncharacterized protein (TIGR02646 family)